MGGRLSNNLKFNMIPESVSTLAGNFNFVNMSLKYFNGG